MINVLRLARPAQLFHSAPLFGSEDKNVPVSFRSGRERKRAGTRKGRAEKAEVLSEEEFLEMIK